MRTTFSPLQSCLCVLLLLTCCVTASAQQNTPQASAPKLRTTSRIVYVDVVVRDSSGKIVKGLQRDNFFLTENKEPQRVSFFEAHPTEAQAAQATTQRAAGTPDEVSNVASSARDTNLNLVLLDLLNTGSVTDQAYTRKRMVEFLRKLPAGQQVALFVLTNRLRMVQGFTTDSEALVAAAKSINLEELNRQRTVGQQVNDLDFSAYQDIGSTRGFNMGQNLQIALGSEDLNNIKSRLDGTSGAFREIARAVSGFPGRKNLFWLAGEFPSTDYYRLGSTASPLLSQLPQGLGEGTITELIGAGVPGRSSVPGLGLSALEEKADKAVADSQIAVYPISLAGVQTDFVGAASSGYGTAGNPGSASNTSELFFNERQASRAVMDNIADRTGGEAFYGNNDPAAMLQRGFEDSGNYYELAYQPTNHNWDGGFREIKLAIKGMGSGYHLSYRKGYYALPEQPQGNALASFAEAMRLQSPPSTQLVIHAIPPTASTGSLQFQVKLDPTGVGFTTSDNGDRRAKLQVMMIAYPVGGDGALAQKNQMLNMGLTEKDYRDMLRSGVPFQQTLALKPGRYAVRLGIVDLGSGRIGTLTVPFTMPGA